MCLCIHARMQSIHVNSFILLIQKFVRCYVGGKCPGGKYPRGKCTRTILTDKNHSEHILPDKKHPDKTPRQEPSRTKINLPVKTYVCMHVLLKMRGDSEMCDVL